MFDNNVFKENSCVNVTEGSKAVSYTHLAEKGYLVK